MDLCDSRLDGASSTGAALHDAVDLVAAAKVRLPRAIGEASDLGWLMQGPDSDLEGQIHASWMLFDVTMTLFFRLS